MHHKHHGGHHGHHHEGEHHGHDPHHSHHHSVGHHKHHGHHGSHGISKTNPDHGPAMHEGAHHWDKGYVSDSEMSEGTYPERHMRGNNYLHLQDEIRHRDSKKLSRSKREKIS